MSGAQEPPVGPPADAGPASVPGRRRAARPQPPPAGFAEPVDAPPTTAFTSPRRSLAERARRGTTPPGHASAANRSTPADVRPETTGRGAT
ncbi:MAG: hypothetical protein IRZ08_11440, partial [Frankia sp.]|nr:hypothetical protein [Frankia sp.]